MHFCRVNGAGKFADFNSSLGEQFEKLCVSFRVMLRLVQNSKIALKVQWPKCRLYRKWMIGSQADHKPVAPNFFHTQFGMLNREGCNRRVDLARDNIAQELNCVGVLRADRAARNKLLLDLARGAEQFLGDQSSTAQGQGANMAFPDRDQRCNDLVPREEKAARHWGSAIPA